MASVNGLSIADIAIIKARIKRGDYQHNIAADYSLNQGRICEIKRGHRFGYVLPATEIPPEA